MTDEELLHLHNCELKIALEIKRVCDKNSIKYSLVGGSLIGAVRHKGFIPWDDDMDIGMLRSEYEKFIDACSYDLGDEFVLQNWDTDKYYNFRNSKIILKNTKLIQHGHEGSRAMNGIFVDVFPFDYVPENKLKRMRQAATNYVNNQLLMQKSHFPVNNSFSKLKLCCYQVIRIMSTFFSRTWLIKTSKKSLMRYNGSMHTRKHLTNMTGYYGYKKEILSAHLFSEYTTITFSGIELSVIKDYKVSLSTLYGDYMELPPVDKRRTHEFVELDFGKY